jgi:hypothetical protein
MKRPKQRKSNRRSKPGKRTIVALASRGLNRDEIAKFTGLTVARLRSDFPLELSEGRAIAKAAKADTETALTKRERHFIRVIHDSFANPDSDWFLNGEHLLWGGPEGRGARTFQEAWHQWRLKYAQGTTLGMTETEAEKIEAEQIYAEMILETEQRK